MSDREYDDLDDLLDEDPSALEVKESVQTSLNDVQADKLVDDAVNHVSDNVGKDNAEGKEMQTMLKELESEFSQLMNNGGDGDEIARNFQELVGMLGNASGAPPNAENLVPKKNAAEAGVNGSGHFKNIVASTLDKIKENGTKVDDQIQEEKEKSGMNDELLTQLLGQLSSGAGEGTGDVDDTIMHLLDQMSSKQVLYQPMKELHQEYTKWFAKDENTKDLKPEDLDRYKKQYALVKQITDVYESSDYDDGRNRKELTALLDDLEQLGESPVNPSSKTSAAAMPPNVNDLLEVDGKDVELEKIANDLQDSCKQQ